MSYCVYKHTFPNGKVYIGITGQKPKKRWQNGFGYLQKIDGKYVQPLIANAILKYGWDNVEHEVIYNDLTKCDAETKEIEMIAFYKSNDNRFGYNIANGGSGIGVHAKSSKEKMSKTRKGVKFSEEHKNKISKSLKIRWDNGGHPWNGRALTEDHKEKISKSNKGRKRTKEAIKKMSKPVVCVETNVIYDSAKDAERQTGVHHENIAKVCLGERKTAGGYHWQYVNCDDVNKQNKRSLSDEIKKKISESRKNKTKVFCIETKKYYESLSFAEKETGISRKTISKVCKGIEHTAGGYHWKYADDNIKKEN